MTICYVPPIFDPRFTADLTTYTNKKIYASVDCAPILAMFSQLGYLDNPRGNTALEPYVYIYIVDCGAILGFIIWDFGGVFAIPYTHRWGYILL
jgi:hypothetical protein